MEEIMNTIIFACSTLRKELLAAMKENNNHTPIFFLPREVHTDTPSSSTLMYRIRSTVSVR